MTHFSPKHSHKSLNKGTTRRLVDSVGKRGHGVCVLPVINGVSPDIEVSGGEFYAYENADYTGSMVRLIEIPAASLELTVEETTYYLFAFNDGGAGQFLLFDNDSNIQDGRYVPIARVIRKSTFFHTFFYDSLCSGFENKVQYALEHVLGFRRLHGLVMSTNASRNLSTTAGEVALGAVITDLAATDSSVTNLLFGYKDALGTWQISFTPTLNNLQYQTPTGLVTLSPNRYAVNWVWRGIEDQDHVYVAAGTGDYKLDEALDSGIPEIPEWVSNHAILLGRIIYIKGSNTVAYLQTVADLGYVFTGGVEHDSTTNKSGTGPEYYHLNALEYANLSGTDWPTVKKEISVGETCTVNAGRQLTFQNRIINLGRLVNLGELYLQDSDESALTDYVLTTTLTALLAAKANLASPTFTGTVSGITAAMVGAPSGSGTHSGDSSGTNTGDQTNISGSSGSCTGNAATATVAASCSGNSATATNATNLVGGTVRFAIPVYTASTTHTLAADTSCLIVDNLATCTITLGAASSYPGRFVFIKRWKSGALVSASSNVCPIDSNTPGTAILSVGYWVQLVSDGTNWVVMAPQ